MSGGEASASPWYLDVAMGTGDRAMSDLPRVSAILAATGLTPDYSRVPDAKLEHAAQRGTAVHEAIAALTYGYLDEAELTEEVAVRLGGWRAFLKDSGYQPIAAEFEVVNEVWAYCGRPDSLGWLLNHRTMVEIKAIDSLVVAPAGWQVAAYGAAYSAQHPTEPVAALGVVQLKSDGGYKYHEVSASEAEPKWFAACVVFAAQKEIGRGEILDLHHRPH